MKLPTEIVLNHVKDEVTNFIHESKKVKLPRNEKEIEELFSEFELIKEENDRKWKILEEGSQSNSK